MRTTIGLIIGLALGMLLMHFSTSAFRVSALSGSKDEAGTAPSTKVAPRPPAPMDTFDDLAAALLHHWAPSSDRETVVVLLAAGEGTSPAAKLNDAVRQRLEDHDHVRVITLADPDAALPAVADTAIFFSADHGALSRLAARIQRDKRAMPRLYTAGWSTWLEAASEEPNPVLTGAALRLPTGDPRRMNDLAAMAAGKAETSVALNVRVVPPADIARLFATPIANATTTDTAPEETPEND